MVMFRRLPQLTDSLLQHELTNEHLASISSTLISKRICVFTQINYQKKAIGSESVA